MTSRSRSRSPRRSHSRPRDRYDDRRYRDRGRDRHGDNGQEGGYRRRGGYSRDHGRDYGRDRDRESMADDYPYRRRNEKKERGSGRDGARERDVKADNYPYRRRADDGERDREAISDLERQKNRNEDEERGRARGNAAYSKDLADSDPRDGFSPKKHPDSPRDEDTQRDDLGLKSKKSSFRFKGDAPRRRSRSPRRSDASSANVGGLNFVGPSKPKKKEKLPANTQVSKPAVGEEPIIVVHINDRLGTKAAIPCLASDRIKEFKILVAARIGREPHEILLKRQGERPFKDQLSLEDYGISNGVQLDLEVDTGD